MVNYESIRETLVPPIVATTIAIGLVSDWSSAATPDSAVVPDVSTTTASRSDSYINKMSYPGAESGGAMLIRLVYRLPLFTGQHGQYTQALPHQRAMAEMNNPALVSIKCSQVIDPTRPSKTWWM